MLSNEESVETKLKRIAEKARKDPKCQFTSLFHLMNLDLLWGCFWQLKKCIRPVALIRSPKMHMQKT